MSEAQNFQKYIENSIKNEQYKFFENWVDNFGSNLENIWKENSAGELNLDNNNSIEKNSAIVIGRGPSIKKHDHLKLLSESNFQGSIVCCDGKLADVLKSGITPDKFPNFYVVTIDPYLPIKKFYDHSIIDEYGSRIKALFTTIADPNVVNRARNSGMKIHWFHSLFDLNEGQKSFNQISARIVRTKKHLKGLPAIQTGGNVGTSSWFVSWKILKCSNVGLIGINHGWEEDDPWDLILSHTLSNNEITSTNSIELDHDSEEFKKLFPIIHNPDLNSNCILDPIFQFYRTAFIEFISRSPSWVKTINATEGGSIFGKNIETMKFIDFLTKFQK